MNIIGRCVGRGYTNRDSKMFRVHSLFLSEGDEEVLLIDRGLKVRLCQKKRRKTTENGAKEKLKVSVFQACRLKNYVENWRNITFDRNVLDIVQHCHMEFMQGVNPVKSDCKKLGFLPKKKKL
jgi:hypothetical protein